MGAFFITLCGGFTYNVALKPCHVTTKTIHFPDFIPFTDGFC